jgi:hypothetical protein
MLRCVSLARRMTTTAAIRADGSLVKFEAPTPSSAAAIAAASGDVAALERLHAEERLGEPCSSANTPLIWAADAVQQQAVEYLLSVVDIDINAKGFLGSTALSRAARRGDAAILRALANDPRMATLDEPNDKMQYPLHFAAFKRNPACVKVLLEAGASTEVADRKGRTPDNDTDVDAIRDAIRAVRAGANPANLSL